MLDWDKLRIFYSVAKSLNFTRAAEELHLSQSAVSRHIQNLEDMLKSQLFQRAAKGLILTEEGELLFKTAAEMKVKIDATTNAMMDVHERPRGRLKISAPVALGTIWLTPMMKEFMSLYPEIDVSIIVSESELDLQTHEADMAIRFLSKDKDYLIQKKLFSVHNALYASNHYLKEHGIPKSIEDLENHKLVIFGEDVALPFVDLNWVCRLISQQSRDSAFEVNSLWGMFRAAKNDIGIAALPTYMATGSKTITKILPKVVGPDADAYLVYLAERRTSKRINAFKNFIIQKAKASVF